MIDTVTLRTDAELIEPLLERGFDPDGPVSRDDFLRLLGDAEALDAAGVEALPPSVSSMGDEFGDTGRALTLPVAVAYLWLERLLETSPVSFSERARLDAVAMLVRRLVSVLQQTIQFEAIVSRSTRQMTRSSGDNDQDKALLQPWLDRWRMFPVLAALVTTTLTNWIRALDEMIRALEQDHADIATALSGLTTPLAVQAIHGDAGDVHLGGRSVMLLTFADDRRVVFKPKRLAITDVFRALVRRINVAGFSTPLHVHAALVRDGHTWEQFVAHRSCTSKAEVERFYHRMGGWIRLLQVLEGRDFWLDNLIANGEFPVFIDLETIMQPRRGADAIDDAAQLVQDRIDTSPAATNIVAMMTPIGPDAGSEDLGCFAPPRAYLSPFPATSVPGVMTGDVDRHGYRTWSHPEHAPQLRGEHAPAEAWFGAIEAGYREMAEIISRLAPELRVPGGLIEQLSVQPVRTIYRDTWTCVKIINRSVAPPLLGHWQRRKAFLASLHRSSATNDDQLNARTSAVVAAESRAIAGLDVPFFTSRGSSDAIFPPDASPVQHFFDGTVRATILGRLETTTPETVDEDVAFLRTSFWTTHRATAPMPPLSPVVQSDTLDPDDFLGAAVRIGNLIGQHGMATPAGAVDWPALGYHPSVDIESITPLGTDVLSGRAGVALLAHDLWHATRDRAWRQRSRQLQDQIADGVRQTSAWWRHADASKGGAAASPSIVGAHCGLGGMLATLDYLGTDIGTFLEAVDWSSVLSRAPHDVVTGTVGLALALTARGAWIPGMPDALRSQLEERIVSDAYVAVPRPPNAVSRLGVVPSVDVARLLVRHRLKVDTTLALPAAIEQMVSNPDITTGDLLGVIEMSRPADPWWRALHVRVTDVVGAVHTGADDRVAELDAAELALAMYRQAGDAAWRAPSAAIARQWISAFNVSGSWFPADLAEDRFRLSLVWGLPALGSVLLRLSDAPVMSSPRTFRWSVWDR